MSKKAKYSKQYWNRNDYLVLIISATLIVLTLLLVIHIQTSLYFMNEEEVSSDFEEVESKQPYSGRNEELNLP